MKLLERRTARTGRAVGRRVSSSDRMPALVGRATRGQQWNPAQAESLAPALQELREPRPYTSRYPISNEAFESLKAAAPKARLRKITAERVRDSSRQKEELSARPMVAMALAPGLQPTALPTGAANFAGIGPTGWLPP